MTPVAIGVDQAAEIAALTLQACEFDPLSATSVRRSVFEDPGPQIVEGVYGVGLEAVAAGVVRGETGYVKLLAVHPRLRSQGIGSMLLDRIESFCRDHGAKTIAVGNSAPYYVVPGVDPRATEAVCLFQARGYRRSGDAVNQSVRLTPDLPEPPRPVRLADARDHERIRSWLSSQHPNWLNEVARAADIGTLWVDEDLGFAAYDVNRQGWFGPMATKGGARRDRETTAPRGVGTSTLLACLHAMRAHGYDRADIAWVGPVAFYARAVQARINRVFWWYRKDVR